MKIFRAIIVGLSLGLLLSGGGLLWLKYQEAQTLMQASTGGSPRISDISQAETACNILDARDFAVPELGMKIKVPGAFVDDLVYRYAAPAPEAPDSLGAVELSTRQLESFDENCSLGIIEKRKGIAQGTAMESRNTKQLGDAFVYYAQPQSVCTNKLANAYIMEQPAKNEIFSKIDESISCVESL